MANKSPQKSTGKTPAAKSLKEKRLEKQNKAQGKATSEINDAVNKKR